ncbi:MAG TPA: gliding motility-associated C-terminal domain-containing protein, partial [Flavobacteriales bacterium]|nr:gliding motility-associated C-terminal domain-containing protein [Flavobacteriales bacterium]
GYQSYQWENGSGGQNHLVTGPGTYTCTVTDFGTSGELVVNGAFNAGATGFSSDYVPGTGGSYGLLSYASTYAVATNPHNTHVNFANFGDHTTGSGNMLVVNGADVPGQNIWCQTVAVQPNTDYAFSAWLASAVVNSPAQLVFTVNGVTVGSPLLAPSVTGQWINFYSIWNSGSNTTATICLTNQNSLNSGNDFTLDDISFAPFCTYTDAIVVTYQDFPEPDLGADVVACDGTPVMIDATWPGADAYSWQDGTTAATFSPTSDGTYWVDVTENGCTGRDSIAVDFTVQPQVELGNDQQRCEGDVDLLNAYFPDATYQWQDGTTAATFSVSGSGVYAVTVDVAGCTATDAVTFVYYPLPIVDLGPDTTICADTLLALDVSRPGGSYVWEHGGTEPQRTLAQSGLYWVEVTENGCSTRDSLVLGTIALPTVDLGPDFLLCKGLTRELDAFGAGYSYVWGTGDSTAQYTVTEADTYWVTVSNPCGAMTDSIEVSLDQCDCPVFVPNAFTPNDDDRNEGFRPVFDCPFDAYEFQVFDRWGELIWESTDATKGWDGGGSAPDGTAIGVYAWRLQLRP